MGVFCEYKIDIIWNQPQNEEVMIWEQNPVKHWYVGTRNVNFSILDGLMRRYMWEFEQSTCSSFMTFESLQWQPQCKDVCAEQVFTSLCGGMLEGRVCMVEFPRLVRETWESFWVCLGPWLSQCNTDCVPTTQPLVVREPCSSFLFNVSTCGA